MADWRASDLPTLGAVLETLTLRAGFNTTCVILGSTLLGLAAGVVGVFALLRRRSLMADALSHAALPGIALAFLFVAPFTGRALLPLLAGAAITGVLGVLCVQGILRHTRLREDAAIGIVLSVFFGVGVVALSVVQAHAPSGAAGLATFIYGQAATMRPADVALMGVLAGVCLAGTTLLRKELALVCFNDDFARVGGWPVGRIDLALMALVVLVTVGALQAVGILLVVALLIIPPVTARLWSDRLRVLVPLAGGFGALAGYLGAAASALLPKFPTGAVIVLTGGVLFVLSLLFAPARGVLSTLHRRVRTRLTIASDHLLEAAAETTPEGASERHLPLDAALLDALAARRGWSAGLRACVVWTLRGRGLAARAPGGLALTPAGLRRGRRVARTHRLWTRYLTTHADIAPTHVDWSVDQVEHVLSDELIARLEADLRDSPANGTPNADAPGVTRP